MNNRKVTIRKGLKRRGEAKLVGVVHSDITYENIRKEKAGSEDERK